MNLRGRNCVVVGGNRTSESKIRDLLEAGAKVTVVAVEVTDAIAMWARTGGVQWENHHYETGDLRDAFVVVTAGGISTNAKVYAGGEECALQRSG